MSDTGITNIRSVPGLRRFQFDRKHDPGSMHFGALSLFQIGDCICDSGFVLSPHTQTCYEISYIVSGRGWFGTNGNRFELSAGDIYICRPGEMHEGGVDTEDPFRYLYLGFSFNISPDETTPYSLMRDMMDQSKTPVCKDRLDIQTPFYLVLQELSNESLFSEVMIPSYLEQIVVLMYRNYFSDWQAKYPGEGLDSAKKRAVYSAIYYIDNHLLTMKDPKEVADSLGYSISYLSHLFQKETGESLRNYYMKRKWQKAVELLRDGKHTVTQVASIMQYDSIHTFSRAFRRVFQLSPTQYIKESERQKPEL